MTGTLVDLFLHIMGTDRSAVQSYRIQGLSTGFDAASFKELQAQVKRKHKVRLKLVDYGISNHQMLIRFEIIGRGDRLLFLLFSWADQERYLTWLR